MKAKVRFFARLSELAGQRETEVEVGEGLTLGDLVLGLWERYPGLREFDGGLMFAVKSDFA
jgi:molybdopterin converting factor small subunit